MKPIISWRNKFISTSLTQFYATVWCTVELSRNVTVPDTALDCLNTINKYMTLMSLGLVY